ncbi:Acyl carrier protein 3, mitochondrial [Glycine soja]
MAGRQANTECFRLRAEKARTGGKETQYGYHMGPVPTIGPSVVWVEQGVLWVKHYIKHLSDRFICQYILTKSQSTAPNLVSAHFCLFLSLYNFLTFNLNSTPTCCHLMNAMLWEFVGNFPSFLTLMECNRYSSWCQGNRDMTSTLPCVNLVLVLTIVPGSFADLNMQSIRKSILTRVNLRRSTERWFLAGDEGAHKQLRCWCSSTAVSSDQILDRVIALAKKYDKIDGSKVTETADFQKDLNLDSLDRVELIMALEEEFSIEIPDEKADKLACCADIAKYIAEVDQKNLEKP